MFVFHTKDCLEIQRQSENESVSHSVVSDSATPWTITHQTPLLRKFSGQEHWSGLLCPPPGDLPGPGIKPEQVSCITAKINVLKKKKKTPEKYVYFITESDPSSLSKRVIQYKIEFFLKDTTK